MFILVSCLSTSKQQLGCYPVAGFEEGEDEAKLKYADGSECWVPFVKLPEEHCEYILSCVAYYINT